MPAKIAYLILITAVVTAVVMESKSSREAYFDCVEAGVQSNDTCSYYTNYKP